MGSIINNTKNKIHNIKKTIQHPEKIVYNICNYDNYQFAKFFSDKLYIDFLPVKV